MTDKENRNRRDYDELKAKLGLKAEKKPASMSDKTPPGGFDLGLERGASELDSQNPGDAVKGVVASDAGIVRSRSARMMMFLIIVVGMGLTGAIGYWLKHTEDNRLIAEKQIQDASDLLGKTEALAVVGGTCTAISKPCGGHGDCDGGYCLDGHCNDVSHGQAFCEDKNACKDQCPKGAQCECTTGMGAAVYRYVGAISVVDREVTKMQDREKITDSQFAALDSLLKNLQVESAGYVKKQPRVFARSFLSDQVFNGEAVKEVVRLSTSLDVLYNAAKVMAQEDIVFQQFRDDVRPDQVQSPSVVRVWLSAKSKADKQGRQHGVLVPIILRKDKDGNPKICPDSSPEGRRDDVEKKRYQFAFEYELDKHKKAAECDKEENKEACSCIATERVFQEELRDNLVGPLRAYVVRHFARYQQHLRARLARRVSQLDDAASPLVNFPVTGPEGGVWTSVPAKLAELAKQ